MFKLFKSLLKKGTCLRYLESNLKLLIITDTHNTITEDEIALIDKQDYDLCFLLGDIPQRDMYLICSSIKAPIYGVPGNHDTDAQYDRWPIHNIHGKVICYKNVTFTGWKGSVKYKETPCCVMTDEESLLFADLLPPADVLISHDSPKYLYDKRFAHSGLLGITKYLNKHNVPINIHGHHHINSKTTLSNGTISVCVYRCVVFDLSTKDITFVF